MYLLYEERTSRVQYELLLHSLSLNYELVFSMFDENPIAKIAIPETNDSDPFEKRAPLLGCFVKAPNATISCTLKYSIAKKATHGID